MPILSPSTRDCALRDAAILTETTPHDAARSYARVLVHAADALFAREHEEHPDDCEGCAEVATYASIAAPALTSFERMHPR